MVGVPVVGVATLRGAVADRLAHIVFVDIDDDYCAVLHRIAAHEGGPTRFQRSNVNGGGTRLGRDARQTHLEKFGDATTAGVASWSQHMRGDPPVFSEAT